MSKNYMVYHSSRGLEAQRQAFMLLYIPRVSLHDNPRALYPITTEQYKAGGRMAVAGLRAFPYSMNSPTSWGRS